MGALLRYIMGGGTGSTSSIFGRWGQCESRGVSWLTAGVRGDLVTALCEAKSECRPTSPGFC